MLISIFLYLMKSKHVYNQLFWIVLHLGSIMRHTCNDVYMHAGLNLANMRCLVLVFSSVSDQSKVALTWFWHNQIIDSEDRWSGCYSCRLVCLCVTQCCDASFATVLSFNLKVLKVDGAYVAVKFPGTSSSVSSQSTAPTDSDPSSLLQDCRLLRIDELQVHTHATLKKKKHRHDWSH